MRNVLALPCLLLSFALPAQDRAAAEAAFRDGQSAVQGGEFEAAVAAFRKATEADPAFGRAWHMLGYSLHAAGKLDEALKYHLKATEFQDVAPVATYNVACVHSLKGDKDKAFEWLGKAVTMGFGDGAQLQGDSDFDNIRDDPRFKKIADSLGKSMQAFVVTTPRKSARVAYFAAKGSPGQIAIDYSPIEWRATYDQHLASPKFTGKKWRFGSDFWTTLDNSMPMVVGGVEIPAGYWYLTLEHKGDKQFVLGVHDPVAVRKQRLDPFKAELLQGGIEVPLAHTAVDEAAGNLEIAILLDKGERTKGKLRVRFGGHELAAGVKIGVEQ
jgi:tetratricopeptide (TPR) repeat protein